MKYKKTFYLMTLSIRSIIAVVFVFMAIGLHTTEAKGLFKSAVNYYTGFRGPASVATRDFNGDGYLDLALASRDDDSSDRLRGNVSILLGNGDGSFQSQVNYGVGDEPVSVAIGDFDGDGDLDLAVANWSSGKVFILLGNGNGIFQDAADYSIGDRAESVATNDFNGDGYLDLAVAVLNFDSSGNAPSNVSILLGNGDGSFQSPVNYNAGDGPKTVAIGDFNGDANLDLAVGNGWNSGNVTILLGNGDGSFQSPVNYNAGDGRASVATSDFNGDGYLDLAVANSGSDNVSILLGNGDGSFQSQVNYGVGDGPMSVAIGDLDGDSYLDLAVANSSSSNVSVLLGNGDGSFQTEGNYGTRDEPVSVAIGDLDGDSYLDLAVANSSSSNVSILINIGKTIINDFVTFKPDPLTYAFTPDTIGCPLGFVGKFNFLARLANISTKTFSNLFVEVDELTNNNLLLTDNRLLGVGGRFKAPEADDYADGWLDPDENVNVPFCVCLQDRNPFGFFVNVLGVSKIPAPVEKTGLTGSNGERDDGELQYGVPWPVPRFTDNGDGTIRDNLTYLTWDKDANRFGTRSWDDALSACNQLADNGVNLTDDSVAGDWHLANRFELESILSMAFHELDFACHGPAIAVPDTIGTGHWSEGDPFFNIDLEGMPFYWSSSTHAMDTGQAWAIFINSSVETIDKSVLAQTGAPTPRVWCVRGVDAESLKPIASVAKTGQTESNGEGDDGELQKGVAWPIPRFTDNGDGTITDNLTYLTWDKNANRFGTRSWDDSLSGCNQLANNGVDLTDDSAPGDWRLANRFELESILHIGFTDPAVPDTDGTGHWSEGDPFMNIIHQSQSQYWTSTLRITCTASIGAPVGCHEPGTAYAETMTFETGEMRTDEAFFIDEGGDGCDITPGAAHNAWCVRGGR